MTSALTLMYDKMPHEDINQLHSSLTMLGVTVLDQPVHRVLPDETLGVGAKVVSSVLYEKLVTGVEQ